VVTERFAVGGIPIADGAEAGVVFVAPPWAADFTTLELAARAVSNGAPLYTGSYARGIRGRQRHDLQPRGDGDGGDREGHGCAAADPRQAVSGRG
jgi:hypothetical protein